MRKKRIIAILERIGVEEFSKDSGEITYNIDDDHGRINIDFWNIDRVIPCIYNNDNTDLVPMSLSILFTWDATIHCNNNWHVFRDIVDYPESEFEQLKTTQDLLTLIQDVQSIGVRIAKS